MMTVRELCKARNGNKPCINIRAADMVKVIDTSDCRDWCPLLRAKVDLLVTPRVAA